MSIKSISTRRISAQSIESGSTVSFNVDNGNTYISGAFVNSSSNAYLQIITAGAAANNVPLKITPIITSISVADSGYNVLDDTAVNTTGGYIVIDGFNFTSTCAVYIGATLLTSSFVSKNQLRAVVPATAAGSYSVAVVDGTVAGYYASLSISAFPNWTSTSYTSTSLTVSVQLLVSGDAPLTFSLISGTLPSGLSVSSSGLISGTVATSSTTPGLVFQVDDAQNQSTQATVSLVIVNADDYWKNTAFSVQSPKSFITDSSNNAFIPTIAGDTRAATFNPFGDRQSVYFNGSNSSLSASSTTAFDQDTDFTVEMWVKAYGYPATQHVHLYRPHNSGSGTAILTVSLNPSGKIVVDNQQTGIILTSTATINLGVWYHVALTRNGPTTSNVLLFINGALDTTVSYSGWQSTPNSIQIGSRSDVARVLNGHISNLRVTKGNALYTTAFTPPRGTLTKSANVTFLTCQSNTIVDNSVSNLTITANAATVVSNTGPAYQAYTLQSDGSAYFDGTGDYLTYAANTAFQFGNNNFTVECWVFPQSLPAEAVLVSKWNATGTAGTNQWLLSLNTGVPTFITSTDGSAVAATATGTTIITNTWNHIAAVRNGSSLTMYVNGIPGTANTSLSTSSLYGSETEVLGVSYRRGATVPLTGYMSNLRIVKGQALYTANFATNVASSALTTTSQSANASNVSLLTLQTNIHYDNTKILDNSAQDFTVTRTSGTYHGSFSPTGNNKWGVWFSGSTSYVAPVANAVLAVGTGDFCFEAWAYPIPNTGIKFIGSTGAGGTGTWQLGVNTASGSIRLFKENNTQIFNDTTATLSFNTWNHVALVRSGANTGVYINGTLANTIADSTNYSNTSLTIGAGNTAGGSSWNGYLSNVRLIKGAPVYQANFGTPSEKLVANSVTSILTCASPSIKDISTNALTITGRTGASAVKIGPYSDLVEYSPASHAGSLYFNNSSDYLSIASNTNLTPGGEDFTYEGWFWHTALASGTAEVIWDATGGVAGTTVKIQSSLASGTPGYLYYANNANRITSGNSALIIKEREWQHLAISRSSGTTKMFVDGVQQGSDYVDSFTYTAAGITMGRDYGAASNFFGGYMSQWRFVKGRALYTAAFTPDPNIPLSAVPGTQLLLTAQNAGITDYARNAHMTTNLNAKSSSFRKYSNTSLTLDGTGDYVSAVAVILPNLGANNFTIDCWIYPTTVSKVMTIFDCRATASGPGISIEMNASGNLYSYVGATQILLTGGQPALNTWSHIALARVGSTVTLYLNGTSPTNGSNSSVSTAITDTNYLIGTYYGSLTDVTTNRFQGYIDELRVTPGAARYTTTFVAPTIHSFGY